MMVCLDPRVFINKVNRPVCAMTEKKMRNMYSNYLTNSSLGLRKKMLNHDDVPKELRSKSLFFKINSMNAFFLTFLQ